MAILQLIPIRKFRICEFRARFSYRNHLAQIQHYVPVISKIFYE